MLLYNLEIISVRIMFFVTKVFTNFILRRRTIGRIFMQINFNLIIEKIIFIEIKIEDQELDKSISSLGRAILSSLHPSPSS